MARTIVFLVALALGASAACSPGAPVCPPNDTHTCNCGALTGSQVCNAEGTGYSACDCSGSDGGSPGPDVVTPPGPDVNNPPGPDVNNPPPSCSGATTCATCTPLNGCGFCNGRCVPGTASGSSDGQCSGSSWAWLPNQCTAPPMCPNVPENTAAACSDGCDNDGNGYTDCNDFHCCNAVTCGPTTSCGRRRMCTACSATGTCAAGFECASRLCDARRACYPAGDPNASCDTVDGAACPTTAAYDRCTSDAQCGPLATCAIGASPGGYGWMVARCNHTLGCQGMAAPGCGYYGPNPCPGVDPAVYPGITAACAVTGDTIRGPCYGCILNCATGARCPYGLRCASGRCVD